MAPMRIRLRRAADHRTRVRVAVLVVMAVSVLASLSGWGAPAHATAERSAHRQVLYVGITSVCIDKGADGNTTTVGFRLDSLNPATRTWSGAQDQGMALSTPKRPYGVWWTSTGYPGSWALLHTTSGGEGHLRVAVPSEAELLTVNYGGWTSPPAPASGMNCP
jgi:hypothetical protein